MKKLRSISIILLVFLLSCFCLTACNDSKGKSYSATFKEKHTQELADVLSSMLILTGAGEFENESVIMLVNQMYSDNEIDILGKELFKRANFTDEKISKLLVAVNQVLETNIYCNENLAKFNFNTASLNLQNLPTGDVSTVDPMTYAMQLVGVLKENSANIIAFIDDNAEYISGLTYLEKETLATCIQKVVDAYNNLSDAIDGKTYASLTVEAILNKENLGVVFDSFTPEQTAAVDNAHTFLKGIGADEKKVKNAYVTLLAPFISFPKIDTFFTEVTPTEIIKNIGVYNDYRTSTNKFAELKNSVELKGFLNEIIKGLGLNVQAETLSEQEIQELISAGQVLDKNGLGILLKRYLPFANYSSDFIGRILEVLNLNDLIEILNKTENSAYFKEGTDYAQIKEILVSLSSGYPLESALSDIATIADDPDEGLLILSGIICEQIANAKTNYVNYELYVNAVNTAMADGGVFINSFFTNVDALAKESKKLLLRDYQEMKTVYNNIKIHNLPKLINLKSGLDKTIENVELYVNPIYELFNQLFKTNNGGNV